MKKLFIFFLLICNFTLVFSHEYVWGVPLSAYYNTREITNKTKNNEIITEFYGDFNCEAVKASVTIDNYKALIYEIFIQGYLRGVAFTLPKEKAKDYEIRADLLIKGICEPEGTAEESIKTLYANIVFLDILLYKYDESHTKLFDYPHEYIDTLNENMSVVSIYQYSKDTLLFVVENLLENETLFIYQSLDI